MKKIVFIIPYFGKFNNYFPLFLKSCEKNFSINWLIYTDDKTEYDYPKNVKVIYCRFDDIKKRIQNKFPYEISLGRAYKLCDYRPLYGFFFEEDIKEYDYWGYCDTDLIWGNIEKFLFPILKEEYDKLFFLGHCSLYKKTDKLHDFIKFLINNNSRIKEIYTAEENKSFDEEFKNSINNILEKHNFKIFYDEFEANIYMKSSNFNLVRYNFDKKEYEVIKRNKSIFIYDNGALKQYYIKNNEIVEEEFMYIHMQSRKMEMKIGKDENIYKIIPNSFEKLEVKEINLENYYKIKRKNLNLHYFKLRGKNLKIKLLKLIKNKE